MKWAQLLKKQNSHMEHKKKTRHPYIGKLSIVTCTPLDNIIQQKGDPSPSRVGYHPTQSDLLDGLPAKSCLSTNLNEICYRFDFWRLLAFIKGLSVSMLQ